MSGNMGVLPTKERLQKKLQTNFKEIFCKQQIDDTEYGQIYKSPIPWRVWSISSEIALILHFSA